MKRKGCEGFERDRINNVILHVEGKILDYNLTNIIQIFDFIYSIYLIALGKFCRQWSRHYASY